ncbi:unnamed protein product, partial [Musa acuminata subsp. burmannicoides]
KHGVHLLVLSHVCQVGWLKRACEMALASGLAAESVVDLLVLARQLRRVMAASAHGRTGTVPSRRTEAWRFLQDNDPGSSSTSSIPTDAFVRYSMRRRKRAAGAMQSLARPWVLQHICTDGCRRQALRPRGATARPHPLPEPHRAATQRSSASACGRKQQQLGAPRCKRLAAPPPPRIHL